jgi:hypothetical protein
MASAVFPPALSTIGCRVAINAGAIIAAAITAVGAAPAAAVVVVMKDTYAVDVETLVAPLVAVVVTVSTSRYEVWTAVQTASLVVSVLADSVMVVGWTVSHS